MRVFIETPTHSFTGKVVKGDEFEEFEGFFVIIDDDDGARLRVNGATCDVTILPACGQIGIGMEPKHS